MAESRRLRIVYSGAAERDLEDVWEWNEKTYGLRHADEYRGFLREQIDALSTRRATAKPVPGRPAYHFVTIRRTRGSHGHIVVFLVEEEQLGVVRIFHSAQNWQKKRF